MPMQRLRTYFCLPPGPLSGPVIRLLLQRAFGEYPWLRPTRYGFAHQELGDGRVLVQPYELPTQAMTPEGDAAEHRLITVLGPGCFYDHEQHRKPTRLPELLPIAP
jgi:hypothetical protein